MEMKHCKIILCFVLLVGITSALYAEDYDYKPSELPILVSDFELSCNILDKGGYPVLQPIDGIAAIRILREDKSSREGYTLTLYLDRSYVVKKDNITLPYDFKWNFKGLSEGDHEFIFILRNKHDKIGILNFDITVEH